MSALFSDQASVTFHYVGAYFLEVEWNILEECQKELYKKIIKAIHSNLMSQGYSIVHHDVIFKIKKEDEKNFIQQCECDGHEKTKALTTSLPIVTSVFSLSVKREEDLPFTDHPESEMTVQIHPPVTSSPGVKPDIFVRFKQDGFRTEHQGCEERGDLPIARTCEELNQPGSRKHSHDPKVQLLKLEEPHVKDQMVGGAVSVAFTDVAAYFWEGEWDLLGEWQKELYKKVVKEIHSFLISWGYLIDNPDVIFKIKKEDEKYFTQQPEWDGKENVNDPTLSLPIVTSVYSLNVKQENDLPSIDNPPSDTSEQIHPPVTRSQDCTSDPTVQTPKMEEVHSSNQSQGGEEGANTKIDDRVMKNNRRKKCDGQQMEKWTHKDHFRNAANSSVECEGRSNGLTSTRMQETAQNGERLNTHSDLEKNSIHHSYHENSTIKSHSVDPQEKTERRRRKKKFVSTEGEKHISKKTKFPEHRKIEAKKKLLKCTQCEKCFAHKAQLEKHMKIHLGGKAFKCTVCKESFSRKSSLTKHKSIHRQDKPFKCTDCEKWFASRPQHQINKKLAKVCTPFKCSECDQRSLQQHQLICLAEKLFKCSECDKAFSSKSELRIHESIHTGEKPFKCPECDKHFCLKSRLTNHEKIHTGEKPFKCSKCDKCFSRQCDVRTHEKIHTGEKPFECSECDKTFLKKSDLRIHQRIHTGEKPFKCSECDKYFSSKSPLRKHERIHMIWRDGHREKPFPCSECDKSFSQKYILKKHERIHTGEKPFKCSECDKGFSVKFSLQQHEMTHTGQKPFKCFQCDKSFSSKSLLRNHERIHIGSQLETFPLEKLFKCSECDKSFHSKSDLSRHKRTHTGEKPFKCYECNKGFSLKCTLQQHEMTHTGQKPFKCSECAKGFSSKSQLRKHERIHTGETKLRKNEHLSNVKRQGALKSTASGTL